MSDFDLLFKRLDHLLDRVENLVSGKNGSNLEADFDACRWSADELDDIAAHFADCREILR